MTVDPTVLVAVVSSAGGVAIAVLGMIPTMRKSRSETRRSIEESYTALLQNQTAEIARIDEAIHRCHDEHEKCEEDRRATLEELHVLRMKVDRLEKRMTGPGHFYGE